MTIQPKQPHPERGGALRYVRVTEDRFLDNLLFPPEVCKHCRIAELDHDNAVDLSTWVDGTDQAGRG